MMIVYRSLIVIALGLVFRLNPNAFAADYYVARSNAVPVYPFNNGWASAATNIQDAVNAAPANSTVWVAPGTYTVPTNAVTYQGVTNVVDIRKALTLRSSNGVPAQTIIDGQGRHRGIYLYASSGSPRKIIVDGFTLTDCWATNGGAIYMGLGDAWTSIVQNCSFKDNTAVVDGGAINVGWQAFAALRYTLSNCLFQGNAATNGGGGALSSYVRGATAKATITDCTIISNTSGKHGGAIYLYPAPTAPLGATIRNCAIKHNTANTTAGPAWGGGGIYCGGGNTYLYNCLIQNNSGKTGGGVYVGGGATLTVDFNNCTVVSNTGNYGSAVAANNAGSPMSFVNTIIYYDTMDPFSKIVPSYTNCCVDPRVASVPGVNNFSTDPSFISPAAKNYRLSRDSVCINSGTNLFWMHGKLDLDGSARIDSGIVDRGCYEYRTLGSTISIR